MSSIVKVSCLLLLGGAIGFPIALSAQQPSSSAGAPALNEQQRTGKGLFLQNCALCHLPEKKNPKSTTEEGTSIGPKLNGLLSGAKPLPDAAVRTFIMQGVKDKMPSFQYGLEPKEIDAIIAY